MAVRQIKPSKGANELYDAGRGHVCAEKILPLPDNMKKKISVILEAIPSKSKSEIAEVLQACDYDVDRALSCFIADGENMEEQNEWTVQGKRKNNKKKKKKKSAKDKNDPQSTTQNTSAAPTSQVQSEATQKNNSQDIANKVINKDDNVDNLPTTSNQDNPKPLENLKPVTSDAPESVDPPTTTSPEVSPSPLSPTESLASSQDSQTLNKSKTGSSGSEKHQRTRTISGSGSEVIKRSLKDLQRSSVSISRYQAMLDEQAELSTKQLAKSFQEIRQTLDERERYLEEQLKSVIEEAKNLLEERQEDSVVLRYKCNRVGTMSDEDTSELRNEIKHFVGERRIDEELGKAARFVREQEKFLEAVKNFGEVSPIKHHYTPYQRKNPEPSKTIPHKPHPRQPAKTTSISSNVSTTPVTTTSTSSETKPSNSRNDKRPVLSPARLKDQAEIHARLQQAVKEQQVSPASKEVNKPTERSGGEKAKPKDMGPKPNKNSNNKGQQSNSHREQTTQRQRQNSSSQNSTKFHGNRNENKSSNNENSKNADHVNGAKEGSPVKGASKVEDGGPVDDKTQNGTSSDNGSKAQENKSVQNNHGTYNQGNNRTKRRYYRKTPLDNGGPVFRTGTVDTKNGGSVAKETSESKSAELANTQLENNVANGTDGFVPLPQRRQRQRKVYYKKDPGSKIEFPPPRENGSVPTTE